MKLVFVLLLSTAPVHANELHSACVKSSRERIDLTTAARERAREIARLERLLDAKKRELRSVNMRLEITTEAARETCTGLLKRSE